MENQNPQIPPQNIPEQPPQVPPPLSKIPSINYLKTIGIGMSIVSFCIAIAVIGYVVVLNKNATKQVACTMEAKLCPNGTSVGRTGPKCEFAACPTTTPIPDPTAKWKTFTGNGFTIKYPPEWFVNSCGNSLTTNLNPTNQSCETEGNAFAINISPIVTTDYSFSEFKSSEDLKKLSQISIDGQNSYQTEVVSSPFEYLDTRIKVKNGVYDFILNNYDQRGIYDQILSTFKFTDVTPTPTCMQRPACLDATPRCLIPEPANGWCPK